MTRQAVGKLHYGPPRALFGCLSGGAITKPTFGELCGSCANWPWKKILEKTA